MKAQVFIYFSIYNVYLVCSLYTLLCLPVWFFSLYMHFKWYEQYMESERKIFIQVVLYRKCIYVTTHRKLLFYSMVDMSCDAMHRLLTFVLYRIGWRLAFIMCTLQMHQKHSQISSCIHIDRSQWWRWRIRVRMKKPQHRLRWFDENLPE